MFGNLLFIAIVVFVAIKIFQIACKFIRFIFGISDSNEEYWVDKSSGRQVKPSKNYKAKIKLESIPHTQYYLNVRAAVSIEEWMKIAKIHYKEAEYHCEICSSAGRMECHELWAFDETNLSQKLVGMVALCHECHGGIHFGHTVNGKDEADAINITRLIYKVNGWNRTILESEIVKAKAEAKRLTNVLKEKQANGYKLDLRFLNQSKYQHTGIRTMTDDERGHCIKKDEY